MSKKSLGKYIESHPEILGGAPVIKNTRITVSAVKARLRDYLFTESDGTLNISKKGLVEMFEDYPEIPKAAYIEAIRYARANSL